MDISGSVEISRSPSLEDQHKTERKEDAAQQNKAYLVEWLTLVAVVIYAGLTLWQAILTREIVSLTRHTYEISERPYLGSNGIRCQFLSRDKKGGPVIAQTRATAEGMNFFAGLKNYGPVPGLNFHASWRVFENGIEKNTIKKFPDTPTTFYPTQIVSFPGGIQGEDYQNIANNKVTLELEITLEYDGPTGHYKECVKHAYAPEIGEFMNLGACTHQ